MKLPVKEIKYLNLEYQGTKSDLLNEIFKDIFHVDINLYGYKAEVTDNTLIIYQDLSEHRFTSLERIICI